MNATIVERSTGQYSFELLRGSYHPLTLTLLDHIHVSHDDMYFKYLERRGGSLLRAIRLRLLWYRRGAICRRYIPAEHKT